MYVLDSIYIYKHMIYIGQIKHTDGSQMEMLSMIPQMKCTHHNLNDSTLKK